MGMLQKNLAELLIQAGHSGGACAVVRALQTKLDRILAWDRDVAESLLADVSEALEDPRLAQHIGHAEVTILQILITQRRVEDDNAAEAFSSDLQAALSLVEPDYAECTFGLLKMLTSLNGETTPQDSAGSSCSTLGSLSDE